MVGKLVGISAVLAFAGLATCGPLGAPAPVISDTPIPNPPVVAVHQRAPSSAPEKLDAKIDDLRKQVDDLRARIERK